MKDRYELKDVRCCKNSIIQIISMREFLWFPMRRNWSVLLSGNNERNELSEYIFSDKLSEYILF